MRLARSTSSDVEVDVVGDEERARPDRDRPGRRVQLRRAEVGLAAALADLRLEALVLAAPDIGELLAIGPRGRPRVQVDRQLVAGRDALAEGAGELDAGVHRRRRRAGRTG